MFFNLYTMIPSGYLSDRCLYNNRILPRILMSHFAFRVEQTVTNINIVNIQIDSIAIHMLPIVSIVVFIPLTYGCMFICVHMSGR